MKIAVITYHYSNNKGAFMQTYALCRFLRDLGHEISIIDVRQKEYTPWYIRVVKSIIVGARLKKEMGQHYPLLTRRYYSFDDLQKNPPEADCYIVGSDQVWNPNISKDLMFAYFLDFGEKDVRRISYASSFGLSKWIISDKRINTHISDLLHSFSSLSVREQQGQKLCEREFGIKPEIVLDPTFLNSDYYEIHKPGKIKREIVCYKINKTADFWENAPTVGRELGLPLLLLNYNYPKKGFKYCFPPSLRTWLKKIEEAQFVLTDSFHGIALSIINRKQFVVILNHNDRDSRLINLMTTMGLQKRLFNSLGEMLQTESWKEPIDYSKIEPLISKQVESSRAYLKNALRKE
jgi:hypothetical protein